MNKFLFSAVVLLSFSFNVFAFERLSLHVELPVGWERTDKEQIKPISSEGIKSQFIYGAKSVNGSYFFISYDDTDINEPTLIDDIFFGSSEEFLPWKAKVSQSANAVKLPYNNREANLTFADIKMEGKGSGFDFLTGNQIDTISMTRFFPVILALSNVNDIQSGLLAIDFRGKKTSTKDIEDFNVFKEQFFSFVRIPQDIVIDDAKNYRVYLNARSTVNQKASDIQSAQTQENCKLNMTFEFYEEKFWSPEELEILSKKFAELAKKKVIK